ncbi:MAG: CDP-alcohol phosphatidyltransferase family protein [candidate division FCPU426 bacterium]
MKRQLPNLVTFVQILLGFSALGAVLNNASGLGAGILLLALLADGLSGQLARRHSSASDLGAELDALASLMAFGVSVMVLAFERSLRQLGPWGWAVAVAVAVSVALRLSRDNKNNPDWPLYQGLPVPAFGISVALLASQSPDQPWLVAGVSLGMAALMLSPLRYARLSKRPLVQGSLGVAVLLAVFYTPFRAWFLSAVLLYTLFGSFFGFFGTLEAQARSGTRPRDKR